MSKNTINLIKDSTSTFMNIAQMTQHRVKYVQDRDDESKEKMIKYAIMSGFGIMSLLTMGVLGLMANRQNDDSDLYRSW